MKHDSKLQVFYCNFAREYHGKYKTSEIQNRIHNYIDKYIKSLYFFTWNVFFDTPILRLYFKKIALH